MILSICENPKVLEITRLINIFITIIRIIVPIALVFSLMFKLVGAITKSDEDGLSKVKKIAPKNLIAASIIFLVPTIVRLVVRVTASDISYENCLRVVSVSEINSAYNKQMDKLLTHAEVTESLDDYTIAYKYVKNIKDNDSRSEYEGRLATLKEKIDKYSNFNNFTWKYYGQNSEPLSSYYSNNMPYAIYGPENPSELKNTSLPLIIWLHGAVGRSSSCPTGEIHKHRFIQTIENWESTGLEYIPAIIIAPQFCNSIESSWGSGRSIETIRALVKYATNEYNIDTSKIVLMGHSDGGTGAVIVARENQDMFYAVVIMSGFIGFNSAPDYFKTIKLRGYMTSNPASATDPNGGGDGNTGMKRIFSEIGRSNDLIILPRDVTHDEVQEKAFTTDYDNDGISDLIYWLFYEE